MALLSILGFFAFISLALYIIPQLLILLLPAKNLANRYGKSWALITGASQGLGKCFATTLAKQGMNVILIARDKQALEAVANSIHSKYPSVETRVIVSDLSGDAPTVSHNIFEQVKDLDISTLIINAGFAVPECSVRPNVLNLDVLQTNVVSQLHLFQLIYPRICRRPKNPKTQKTGGVIFISSANALVATPLTQWYSGTKSFLAQFARCLAPEAAPFGVDVVTTLPGIIDSEFQKRLPPLEKCDADQATNFMNQTPAQVVRRTLSSLGVFVECHSGITPFIMYLLLRLLGENALALIFTQVFPKAKDYERVFTLDEPEEKKEPAKEKEEHLPQAEEPSTSSSSSSEEPASPAPETSKKED